MLKRKLSSSKKLILALCMLFCLTGLAACSSEKNSDTAQTNTAAPAATEAATAAETGNQEVDYPAGRNIELILPVAAGGNMDILGRIAGDYLGKAIGTNVVPQNMQGSGGVVAATAYLAQQPNTDSIIFLPANIQTVSPLYNDLEYTIDDFAPIAAYNSEISGVFTLADGPIKSFADLQSWDKDTTLLFGSGGQGVANYLMQAALYKDLGLKAETIPHDSASEGIVNVLAGTTHIVLSSMTLAEQYIAEGSIVPLFTYDDEPYTYADGTVVSPLKDFIDGDYNIPSLQFFAIRSGTDEAIVSYLTAMFREAFADEGFLAEYTAAGGNKEVLQRLSAWDSSDIKETIARNVEIARELYEKAE